MLVESFSGIRGLAEEDLTEELIKNYSLAFAEYIKKQSIHPKIIIGMDTRPSGSRIKKQMIDMILSQGIDVIDVGVNATPTIEHGVRIYNAAGGIIITASHNEPEYNGFKFLSKTGGVVSSEDANTIIETAQSNPQPKVSEKGTLTVNEEFIRKAYFEFVFDLLGPDTIKNIKKHNLKVIVDPNGGAAATHIEDILKKLGVTVITANMELGVFNRKVEPNAESLQYLSGMLGEEFADLAAGFDCDADRVEIVIPPSNFANEFGIVVSGQYLLALLADTTLNKHKGKPIVVNDATSYVVKDVATKHGSDMVEVEVGETNVVREMKKLNAPIGGEGSSSGGIFPPAECRDGTLTLIMLLKLIAETGNTLEDLLKTLPRYHDFRTKVKCEARHQTAVRTKMKQALAEEFTIKETGGSDGGLKAIADDGSWLWMRASKTEPGIFRIHSDSKDREKGKALLETGVKLFQKIVGEIKEEE